VQLSFKEEFCL